MPNPSRLATLHFQKEYRPADNQRQGIHKDIVVPAPSVPRSKNRATQHPFLPFQKVRAVFQSGRLGKNQTIRRAHSQARLRACRRALNREARQNQKVS